ncbi:MAG TPA: endo alpha-1,4 polygalactosaminidase [Burkholderiaceae bacterium]|nr:endo alpha-1,4 polygalactosaminidase [Burkholderiaceae bacterium]
MPAAPPAADTPTGLPYGDARAPGSDVAAPEAAPAAIGSPDWSIAFHYGADPPLDALRAFDHVVLDPDHVADPSVHRRRAPGRSEPVAYVSIGEVHPSRAYAARMPASMVAGRNAAWGGAIVDQAHPDWPRFFVDEIVGPLWARGWRTFFLDTMDAWQATARDDAARAAQQDGLVRAIEAFVARHPDARLIVNRGFEVLPRIAARVSAVAAESVFRRWNAEARRFEPVPDDDRAWLLERLREVRERHRLPAIAIDYLPPGERAAMRATATRIAALGLVPWVADPELRTIGVGAIEPVPRRVLVLHDAPAGADPSTTGAHRFLAMPLQWMGQRVELWNVRERPPPTGPLADRYSGAVAWFGGDVPGRGRELAAWLRAAREQGLRVAFLGAFGAPLESGVGAALGLSTVPGRVEPPLSIAARDPMIGREIEPTPNRAELQPIVARDATRRLLRLADARGTGYDAAAITDWGGYALAPFTVVELPGTDRHRWAIDPFAFLQAALELPPMPVPDPTTETGRRVLMVHVDGDGFASRAELPGAPFSAEVMLREFVARYPVPHTVSVIQAETAGRGLYAALSPALEDIARRIFALPHVEAASHTFSHPFRWRDAVAGVADPRTALAVPGYAFDLDAELAGSARYVDERLAPPGRRTRMLLWSGDTAPPGVAIARAWQSGLLNMNGGETIATRTHPSLTGVAPMSIRREGWLQVLAPNQNENVYTNLWSGPFWGYERTIETFELTGAPRRLKPVDIYYHTYSASKPASIAALRKVYDWAMAQPLHPIAGSDWVRRIVDFEGFVVARDLRRPGTWKLVSDGALRTVRVPEPLAAALDWSRSDGVAGGRGGPDGRWLHLAAPVAWLRPAAPDAALRPVPIVLEANGRIDALRRDGDRTSFLFAPSVAGELVLAHPPDCRVSAGGKPLSGRPARVGERLQSGLDAVAYAPPQDGIARGGTLVSVGCAR